MNNKEWEEMDEWIDKRINEVFYNATDNTDGWKYDENGMFTYDYGRAMKTDWKDTLKFIEEL